MNLEVDSSSHEFFFFLKMFIYTNVFSSVRNLNVFNMIYLLKIHRKTQYDLRNAVPNIHERKIMWHFKAIYNVRCHLEISNSVSQINLKNPLCIVIY